MLNFFVFDERVFKKPLGNPDVSTRSPSPTYLLIPFLHLEEAVLTPPKSGTPWGEQGTDDSFFLLTCG